MQAILQAENPVQAMSDPDIDAAVRFCDDVLSAPTLMLLPPTVEFGKSTWFWKHRTVTYPVARIETASSPALFVKIEIPKSGAWDASVVTTSGACVARWSQKAHAGLGTGAPLELGGTHFGEVALEPVHPCGNNDTCCAHPAPQAIFAKGPTLDVMFAEDQLSKRNDLKIRAVAIMCFTCFWVGLSCWLSACLQADDEPYEALFKTSGGTEIGSYKVEKFQTYCRDSHE